MFMNQRADSWLLLIRTQDAPPGSILTGPRPSSSWLFPPHLSLTPQLLSVSIEEVLDLPFPLFSHEFL